MTWSKASMSATSGVRSKGAARSFKSSSSTNEALAPSTSSCSSSGVRTSMTGMSSTMLPTHRRRCPTGRGPPVRSPAAPRTRHRPRFLVDEVLAEGNPSARHVDGATDQIALDKVLDGVDRVGGLVDEGLPVRELPQRSIDGGVRALRIVPRLDEVIARLMLAEAVFSAPVILPMVPDCADPFTRSSPALTMFLDLSKLSSAPLAAPNVFPAKRASTKSDTAE